MENIDKSVNIDDIAKSYGMTTDQFDDFMTNNPNRLKLSQYKKLHNIGIQNNNNKSLLDTVANNPIVNSIIGAGDAYSDLEANTLNLFLPNSKKLPIPQNESGNAYDIGNFVGNAASYFMGEGAITGLLKGAESLPAIGKAAQLLGGSTKADVLRRALIGGGFGAIQNPNQRGRGFAVGTALSPVADLAGYGISKAIPVGSKIAKGVVNMANPNNWDMAKIIADTNMGPLTADQLKHNLRVTQGTSTPLGAVIQSPQLQRIYDNVLSKMMGNESQAVSANLKNDIEGKARNIMNSFRGDIDPNFVDQELLNKFKKGAKDVKNAKNRLYDMSNGLANWMGLKFNFNNFEKTAKEFEDTLNSNPFLAEYPGDKNFLSALGRYKNIMLQPGSKGSPPPITLKNLNIFSSKILNNAKKYLGSGLSEERGLGNIMKLVGSSIRDDINDSINNSGSPDLRYLFDIANKYYKNNYSNALYKDVRKKLQDPNATASDLVSTFVKTGKDDSVEQMKKLLSFLPPEAQNLVKYTYFRPSIQMTEDYGSKVNPIRLASLWKTPEGLGLNQRNLLFSNPSERKMLNDYSDLVQMNDKALHRMFNANTGQTMLDTLKLVPLAAHGALNKIFSGISSSVFPNIATKYLTNQNFRKKVIARQILNLRNKAGASSKSNAPNQNLLTKIRATLKSTLIPSTSQNVPQEDEDNNDESY